MEEREGCDRRASRRRSLAWDRRGRFSGAWLGGFFRRYFVLWEKARVWICFSQIRFQAKARVREFRRCLDERPAVRGHRGDSSKWHLRARKNYWIRNSRERRCRRPWKRDVPGR